MNNERRRKLNKLYTQLESIWFELEEIKDRQEDYIDSVPESLQNSQRYDSAINSLDCIISAHRHLEVVLGNIVEAIQ